MKVALYARVSTTEQADKGLSIPDQIRQLQDWCKRKNHEIVRSPFVEPGASATDDRRPVFQEMIGEALRKPPSFEAIIVLTTSRFFRDATLARIYKQRLRKNGVRVISATQEVSDDPTGDLVEGLLELVDQHESRMNGFHTLRAMKENARRGYWCGSRVRFGFKTKQIKDESGNAKHLVETDEVEARIVRKMAELYLSGEGAKNIAKRLNEKNLLHRGLRWDRQRILDILGNPAYVGRLYFNREDHRNGTLKPESEWVLINVPPIIDEAMFNRMQEMKKAREPKQTNPAITSSPTLLSGLVKCGLCGTGMTLETGKGGRYRYYNCRDFLRKGPTACKGQRVSAPLLETEIKNHLVDRLFTPGRVREILKGLHKVAVGQAKERAFLKQELQRKLADTEKRLQRIYTVIEEGTLDLSDLRDRLKELQKEKSDLEQRLVALPEPKGVPLACYSGPVIEKARKQLRDLFLAEDSRMAKAYLNFLVEKITLTGKQVKMEGKTARIAAMMNQRPEKTASPALVPTADIGWLPGQGSNLGHGDYDLPSLPRG